jgi:hypothetical protein
VGVPAPDETLKLTVTASPGFDDSELCVIVVVVLAFSTSILFEVTERYPSAAKMSRWEPVPPVILKSLNCARPLASVMTVRVPSSCPRPEETPAVISTPASATSWPAASRIWMTGAGLSVTPTVTDVGGCVMMARLDGEPTPVPVALKVTLPTPETTALRVLFPGAEPRVQRVLA